MNVIQCQLFVNWNGYTEKQILILVSIELFFPMKNKLYLIIIVFFYNIQ